MTKQLQQPCSSLAYQPRQREMIKTQNMTLFFWDCMTEEMRGLPSNMTGIVMSKCFRQVGRLALVDVKASKENVWDLEQSSRLYEGKLIDVKNRCPDYSLPIWMMQTLFFWSFRLSRLPTRVRLCLQPYGGS